jgi:hypothetical protein
MKSTYMTMKISTFDGQNLIFVNVYFFESLTRDRILKWSLSYVMEAAAAWAAVGVVVVVRETGQFGL